MLVVYPRIDVTAQVSTIMSIPPNAEPPSTVSARDSMSQSGRPVAGEFVSRWDCPQCSSTTPPVVTLLTSWQRFQRCEECGFVTALPREDPGQKDSE
jgi:hypothetical protein